MANTPEEPEVHISTVSNKQVIALAGTFITGLAAVMVAYYSNQPDSESELYADLADELDTIRFELSNVGRDDGECRARLHAIEKSIKEHTARYEALLNKVVTFQAEKYAVDKSQDNLIERCMRRTE